MRRLVRMAAVQMQVKPTDLQDRLGRAEWLVEQAVTHGAQLVALPEVFNTGYAYQDENYERSEPFDGPTVRWMKRCAVRWGIHLAGSLLVRQGGEIYNALILVAPDGQTWRYDKQYPWGWERAYFRSGRGLCVAETALGRLGLLICWDVAHRTLWRGYAGQVDAMVICSSPPDVGAGCYKLSGGVEVTLQQMGPMMQSLRDSAQQVFGRLVQQQVAWLGVPAVCATGCGTFESRLPAGRAALLGVALQAPHLLRHLRDADELSLRCPMTTFCRVLAADGRVLSEQAVEEDAWTMATVDLTEPRPVPQGAQPHTHVSPFAYFISDGLLPWISRPLYEHNRQRFQEE